MNDSERLHNIALWVARWRKGGEPEYSLEHIEQLANKPKTKTKPRS